MIATSEKFKLAVYNKAPYHLTARHFLPRARLKVVDTTGAGEYTASSEAFYSQLDLLAPEGTANDVLWGTLEDFQFLLSNRVKLMPDSTAAIQEHPNGWVTEIMTNAAGQFVDDCWLDIRYATQVSSIGRTLEFDEQYDSVPASFDLIYFRNGVEISRDTFRNNTKYQVVSTVGVKGYDRILIQFYATTRPYRRVHMLNDFAGIVMSFDDTDIVSINCLKTVDVTGELLETGETDINVSNQNHGLDILNSSGFEGYLQKKQPFDFSLYQVYPDGTMEQVWMGSWLLYDWQAKNGSMDATFTVRDALERLTQDVYRKGAFIDNGAAVGTLMEELFEDLGVTDYVIDPQFYQVTTTIPLPILTHKELLRQLAQLGQGVVLPTRSGGFHVKYISPLRFAANLFSNSIFDSAMGWTLTNCSLSTMYVYSGMASVYMSGNSKIMQTVSIQRGHKYYFRIRVHPDGDFASATGEAYMTYGGVTGSTSIRAISTPTDGWAMFTSIYEASSSGNLQVGITYNISVGAYLDNFMVIDLTSIYGSGTEPTQEWCDSNIRDILDNLMIPKCQQDVPVDEFDYSILITPPDVQFSAPIGSVDAKINVLSDDAEVSEISKGTRTVRGTQEFDIDLGGLARNCTIALSGGNASLISATWYARSVHATIRAVGEVSWVITGTRVNVVTSDYVLTPRDDSHLTENAEAHSCANVFVDSYKSAETLVAFLAYWLERRFDYNLSWRQNPSIEPLDPVKVHDDYNNKNVALLTEQSIEYSNGVLRGSSKGVV